ncbi:hypothetical protein NQ317_018548 [Molorchus minor]|uniref:Uncharacterized protein n=1 Tax=Molorchus minor TaxID=1323400 RepID=A0ABQ9JYR0_9CUCU|nr:hypothetical protein NQ317_018548 [Molorchus minor]
MKLHYSYIFVLLVLSLSKGYHASIISVINEAIEKLRNEISEPITVKNYTLEVPQNDYLTGTLGVDDLKLSGIKEFNITFKSLLGTPKAFNLTLGYVDLNLKYISDLELLNSPLLSIFGNGNILSKSFLFTGLLDDTDFSNSVTSFLNDNFMKLFNQYSDVISETAREAINDFIAGLLNTTVSSAQVEDLEDISATAEDLISQVILAIPQNIHRIFN